ncbi:MAG: ATP-binding protein [Oscillospiraceae bacterium]|nr:ATP-binding protein [Oscillospiraceae bacterium]
MFGDLHDRLDELAVFRSLEDDRVFRAFHQLLRITGERGVDWWTRKTEFYRFVSQLYQAHTDNWTEYLTNLVLFTETPCTWFVANGLAIPETIRNSARRELRYLSKTAGISSAMMKQHYFIMGYGEFTGHEGLQPDWQAEETDLETLYFERLGHIRQYGFGIWAKYKMFQMKLSDSSEKGYILKPVSSPDTIQLHELVGYEPQRKQVVDNTKALLNGLKASNILLYGSAGTGKSATVKAVANLFAQDGLRLIELSKNELHLLPELLEELHTNPLKFVLFIDDLSFQENDDDFSALKAVLEGSISARANNTVIYATSNRRHIVRETFSQRAGDEIHRNDTVQETISLSERFGIQILFDKPNKDLYLEIVRNLAEEAGLRTNADTIARQAEQFAMRKSGRSARAAKQFVEQLRCAEYQEES